MYNHSPPCFILHLLQLVIGHKSQSLHITLYVCMYVCVYVHIFSQRSEMAYNFFKIQLTRLYYACLTILPRPCSHGKITNLPRPCSHGKMVRHTDSHAAAAPVSIHALVHVQTNIFTYIHIHAQTNINVKSRGLNIRTYIHEHQISEEHNIQVLNRERIIFITHRKQCTIIDDIKFYTHMTKLNLSYISIDMCVYVYECMHIIYTYTYIHVRQAEFGHNIACRTYIVYTCMYTFTPRLGIGDGNMSSMMVHCFKPCVIKILRSSLSARKYTKLKLFVHAVVTYTHA
jgi:hypothetical protein